MRDRGICEICNVKSASYTCPMCCRRYCTSACFKQHKATDECKSAKDEGLEDVVKRHSGKICGASIPKDLDYGQDGEDFVPFERLKNLQSSETLGRMLENQELCDMIRELTKSSNPEQVLKQCMRQEIFLQFANECLRITEEDGDE